jgi:hypothetical protein
MILQGRHRILIEVLDPIDPASFADEDAEVLMLRVRELIENRLEKTQIQN